MTWRTLHLFTLCNSGLLYKSWQSGEQCWKNSDLTPSCETPHIHRRLICGVCDQRVHIKSVMVWLLLQLTSRSYTAWSGVQYIGRHCIILIKKKKSALTMAKVCFQHHRWMRMLESLLYLDCNSGIHYIMQWDTDCNWDFIMLDSPMRHCARCNEPARL